MIEKVKLEELIEKTITGEWGTDLKENEIGTKVIRTADFNNDGTINYDKVVKRNIENKKILDKKLTYGDIIVEKSGGTDKNPVGRVVFFDKKDEVYLANNFTQIIRINKEYNSKYIFYYLMYKYRNGSTNTMFNKTTGIQNLQMKQFLKQNITICDYEKQNNIVKALDLINNVFCIRKEQIEKLNELIKSQFVEMFGNPILNDKNFPVVKVEYIASKEKNSIKAGPFGSSLKKEFYVKNGYKIYGQEQVIANDISFGDYYINEDKFNELKACEIKENDILISLVGTYGKILIVPSKYEKGIINPRLMKITPDLEVMNPYFFKILFGFMSGITDSNTHGGTMGILNVGIVKNMKIILPNIEMQKKFINIAELIDKQKFEIEKSLKEMQELYESLMDKYFG